MIKLTRRKKPVGPRSCCSTQFASERALLAHLRRAHSVGGLRHLSQEKLMSFGLAQCDACLQVLMPGSASHPRNCVALEAGADASASPAQRSLIRKPSALRVCKPWPRSATSCEQPTFWPLPHQYWIRQLTATTLPTLSIRRGGCPHRVRTDHFVVLVSNFRS